MQTHACGDGVGDALAAQMSDGNIRTLRTCDGRQKMTSYGPCLEMAGLPPWLGGWLQGEGKVSTRQAGADGRRLWESFKRGRRKTVG